MNNFFDPNSRLGTSFADIFGSPHSSTPQGAQTAAAAKAPQSSRIGVAKPIAALPKQS